MAPRRLAVLLIMLIGLACIPASASAAPFDCKNPPNPEQPGMGMVGAIDGAPIGTGVDGSAYAEVGYAGLVWHTYDLGCGPSAANDPAALTSSWTGNLLFCVAKVIVGATNHLHYLLLDDEPFADLNDLVTTTTAALYDGVFAAFLAIVALILACLMLWAILRGDLARVGRQSVYLLAGLWLAAATYLTPILYIEVVGGVLVSASNQVRSSVLGQAGVDQRDALPTMLHEQIVYRNWLRGAFGSPDSEQAQRLGRDLLRAQTYTKQEVASGRVSPDLAKQKQAEFERIAGETGPAYGYFTGKDGNRIGPGMLSILQSIMLSLFPPLTEAILFLCLIALRVVVLLGPVIGLVSILWHDMLRTTAKLLGSLVVAVALLSAMTAAHVIVLSWLFSPASDMSVLAQMLIAGSVTVIMLVLLRPWHRMKMMAGFVPGVRNVHLPAILRRRSTVSSGADIGHGDQSAQFWSSVREDRSPRELRPRPEIATEADRVALDARSPEPTDHEVYIPPRRINPSPQPAQREEIDGKPVHVIYRPASGLEVVRPPRKELGRQ